MTEAQTIAAELGLDPATVQIVTVPPVSAWDATVKIIREARGIAA